VYLHEIASKKRQGFTGSIGFASAMFGCMLGVLVVLVLELVLTPTQVRQPYRCMTALLCVDPVAEACQLFWQLAHLLLTIM
jgi:hypothetical protein